jgi:hypothetical protein
MRMVAVCQGVVGVPDPVRLTGDAGLEGNLCVFDDVREDPLFGSIIREWLDFQGRHACNFIVVIRPDHR